MAWLSRRDHDEEHGWCQETQRPELAIALRPRWWNFNAPVLPVQGPGGVDPESCEARVLEAWRCSATRLDVYLCNGSRMQGTLVAFDPYVIALLNQGELQVIFKRAMLTILPAGSLSSDNRPVKRPTLHLKCRAM